MSFSIKHGLFKYDLIDHYAILGMPIDSDPKQVRKQYLKIARNLHPDTLKGKNDAEKKQASEFLSKLVNPAYELLSKPATASEYELVLKQTGKRLAGESGKVALESDIAKQLAKTPPASLDASYKSAIKQIASSQYESLAHCIEATGQLSELNMVYLIRKQGQVARTPVGSVGAGNSSQGSKKPADAPPPPPPKQSSPAEAYIRRAQEYIEKKNYAKALLELRDGIKLEPNNSAGHALLGLCYLKQNQATMAKIHINKALAADPNNPLALQGKQALDRLTGGNTAAAPKTPPKAQEKPAETKGKQQSGLFGGLFRGDKKK
ncbi:J domain-containing protein [Oscillatoria sp. FACHB-1406]|uniref:J domain-containing protein n=1 Tax=Oscillatoria sp. FACHB-1406 TaxID=2692846 RepID=UPI0016892194|nr:J domain-containing protein [Oscillatoria sp. FACHB-1406]MBD2576986.1 DnaJ domain-containing protein [Oscillatoria sp. FACHB-1406]